MKQKDNGMFLLCLSVGGFLLMSVSFLLMPVPAAGILPGLMFWIGLAGGITAQILLEKKRRAFFEEFGVDRTRMQKPRCGLLTFGSGPLAAAADIGSLLSLLLTVIAFAATNGTGYVCYAGIAATVFTFSMHCVLNGRNFFHVRNQNKVRQVLEKKKKVIQEKEREKNDQ